MRDVIVIGGGIAGACTAYFLAADGVAVTLLEQSEPNSRASGANAGSLHGQIQHDPFVAKGTRWAKAFIPALRFYAESIRLWQAAGAELGCDLGVVQTGGLLLAETEAQLVQIRAKARIEQQAGIASEILDRASLRSIAPYVSRRMVGGLFCPLEGKANPLVAVRAFVDAAAARDAQVLVGAWVRQVERDDGGFVVHTDTEKLRARAVVNAAGIDAGRVAAGLGRRLEISAYPIQLSVTEPVGPLIRHLIYSATNPLTLKQTAAGTILIGGGWPARVDAEGRPQVSIESLTRNLGLALDAVPALEHVSIVRSWAATVNGTEDWMPIIGEVPGVPGFFINHVPWMGFTGGPAGGRIVASLVQGHEPPFDLDLKPLRPG